jgi:hypothetical protein
MIQYLRFRVPQSCLRRCFRPNYRRRRRNPRYRRQ